MSCGFVFVRCSHRNHLASYSRIFLKNDPLAGGGNHTIVYRFYARTCKKVFHPFYVLSIFDEGLGEEQSDINSEQLLGKYTCFGLFTIYFQRGLSSLGLYALIATNMPLAMRVNACAKLVTLETAMYAKVFMIYTFVCNYECTNIHINSLYSLCERAGIVWKTRYLAASCIRE